VQLALHGGNATQRPPWHTWPIRHLLPQAPQWPKSSARVAHTPPQQAGLEPGAPLQRVPQAPQLCLSRVTSVHCPWQQVWVSRHGTASQPPQKSPPNPVLVSTQMLLQTVGAVAGQGQVWPTQPAPAGQSTHAPLQHASGAEARGGIGQVWPQAPQLKESRPVSVQAPPAPGVPQKLLPLGQAQVPLLLSQVPPGQSVSVQQWPGGRQPTA
jgi:hypothetical protein